MQELISVIVPIYKVEQYLKRCIESIVNQTYQNIEIILVNDGSPDQCPAMCDAWAKRDARIQVIHKANGGLSDARNAGIDIAKGTYLCFVDSDDWIVPTYVETLYGMIQRYHVQLAIGDNLWDGAICQAEGCRGFLIGKSIGQIKKVM